VCAFEPEEVCLSVELLEETVSKFHDLPLASPLLNALDRAGYETPTPIQAAFIPKALTGVDVIGQAQTGTGKTAAFLLPILNAIREDEPGPQAIVLAPTRELAVQIAGEAEKLAHGMTIRPVAIYGGQGYGAQLQALREGAQLVIGTPGRILDHMGRGTLGLEHVRFAVLDEADRMLDIGFRPDIEKILRRAPRGRQTFLLSATLSPPVRRLAERYMRHPVALVDLSPKKLTVDSIRQFYISVAQDRKFDLLLKVIEREQPRQCIIFCQTKRGADRLYTRLHKAHQRVAPIHGDLPQAKRERIMAGFRHGKYAFLVATDVVARGIDVTNISHIINYDLPEDPESYIHRIGRTGRMGADGVAIAFATPDEGRKLTTIEILMNAIIEEDHMVGFEAVAPRPPELTEAERAAAPPPPPMFGRRIKRYRRAL
jgi:ATP-dependent RNA helicase DeaD